MRIWLSWSFSTGKTSLYENIYKEWHIKNPEIARKVLEEKQVRPESFSKEQLNEFQNEILDRQIDFERDNTNFIQDATLLDFLAYAKDTTDYWEFLKTVSNHFSKKAYDIIFYTPIEFNIEDDWVRHIDKEFQLEIDERIKYNLHMTACKTKTEIYTIKWTLKERVEKVMDILNNI